MIYGDYLRNKYHHAAVKIADAEGVPCVMEYSKGKNLRNYEIYGNSVQEGTPAPDNPVEIQSMGDLTTKNLLYSNATTHTRNGVTMTYDNGVITLNGTCTESANFELLNIALSANTYTLSANANKVPVNNGYALVQLYDSTNKQNILVNNSNALGSTTVTTSVDGNFKYRVRIDAGCVYDNVILKPQLEKGSTATEYEPYHKYDIPITVRGKNLLPNSDWMSGAHESGFNEQVTREYITEYTQNSVSFNLSAWTGVSSPRFRKDSVKRIVFKINQTALNSDGYANFYIAIQGYDDNNKKIGNKVIYDSAIADKKYVFDFSTIASYDFYAKSTQFSFCVLARKNAVSHLMVYDIAYYADRDVTEYEPYIGETKHIYLNEPLRKVGDYADYIDFKNQKIVRNILKQSLRAYNIYKKLNNVIRINGIVGIDIKHKRDSHILSTIFNYNFNKDFSWTAGIEIIFHHPDDYYSLYWSVYWSRLGLTYDGTNVFRTDDAEQTPLTDKEIIKIAKEWLSTLSDEDKEIYVILNTPTEESVSLPALKTFKGTTIISVDTTIQTSNIKVKYIRT